MFADRQRDFLLYAGLPGILLLFYAFSGRHWAQYLVAGYVYTVAIAGIVFTRRKYSLIRRQIRSQLLTIVVMHACFLLLVLCSTYAWLKWLPHVPHWLTAPWGFSWSMSLYGWLGLIALGILLDREIKLIQRRLNAVISRHETKIG